MKVNVVVPVGFAGLASGGFDDVLRVIAVAFSTGNSGTLSSGDPSKYGTCFENDVFYMHTYCWCERDDGSCLHCLHGDHPEFIPLLSKKFGTTEKTYYNKRTGYYDPPHFWYKPSNFRVRWYKYIGRGMAYRGRPPADILERVLESHPSGGISVANAVRMFEKEQRVIARQWRGVMS